MDFVTLWKTVFSTVDILAVLFLCAFFFSTNLSIICCEFMWGQTTYQRVYKYFLSACQKRGKNRNLDLVLVVYFLRSQYMSVIQRFDKLKVWVKKRIDYFYIILALAIIKVKTNLGVHTFLIANSSSWITSRLHSCL